MVYDEHYSLSGEGMLVKKLGVNALCTLRFRKSFQSDNHIYCDSNNSTLDFLSNFIKIGGQSSLSKVNILGTVCVFV